MTDIRSKAEQALHEFIGEDKQFRPGQYEAIEATLTNKRTLVVQRTGWGKSMVYFVCTKRGKGCHADNKSSAFADEKPDRLHSESRAKM